MTEQEMKEILKHCQELASKGLKNGYSAKIPELEINIPKLNSFIGVNNPAIFVTEVTYGKLGRFHEDWTPNITIAISQTFLRKYINDKIRLIGILVHETGHAFNFYAGIPNSELNAYIFEIEILHKLYEEGVLSEKPYGITKEEMQSFFQFRLHKYKSTILKSDYLNALIANITDVFELKPTTSLPARVMTTATKINIQIKVGLFKKPKPSPEEDPFEQSVHVKPEIKIGISAA